MNGSREMGHKMEEDKGEVFIKMRITRARLHAAQNDPVEGGLVMKKRAYKLIITRRRQV